MGLKLKHAGLCLLQSTTWLYLSSEHATQLLPKMFPDLIIAKKFSCSRTKCTAIVKETFAPNFTNSLLNSMVHPFSIIIDESNNKIDKSCIILVRFLDPELEMWLPGFFFNIGTASNLFHAVEECLGKHGQRFCPSCRIQPM